MFDARAERLLLGLCLLLTVQILGCTKAPVEKDTQAFQPPPVAGFAGFAGSAGIPAAGAAGAVGLGAAGMAGAAAAGMTATAGMSGAIAAGTGGMAGAAGSAGTEAITEPPPPDEDSDGIPDETDNCPSAANATQADQDQDGLGDDCDNCPDVANEDQADIDDDGLGNACACDQPAVPCEGGMAGPYPCLGVDMLSRVSLSELGGRSGNASWGYQDPETGRKLALVGLDNGTAFVDVTLGRCPRVVGHLPTQSSSSVSRSVKVFDHYALVVSEARDHGLQVFDLDTLDFTAENATLEASTVYRGTQSYPVTNAHNVLANSDSGFVYIVGARSCEGGLHMVSFANPMAPVFAGCAADYGYIHDALCFQYGGPDTEHSGREICFNSEGDNSFSIVDVTDKTAPDSLSRLTYQGGVYSHEGWLTEDQAYFVLSDELDEQRNGHNTRVYVFDVRDLDAPVLVDRFETDNTAIDHNLVILGDYAYQANYTAGLRILDVTGVATAALAEVAFFDITPETDAARLSGAWDAYPFGDGTVMVSDTQAGLFMLRTDPAIVVPPAGD